MLETHDLTVAYGGVRANDHVSLHVDEGELLGLIGPNGAGKTTFIEAISGFAPLTGGRVLFRGEDVTEWSPNRRARLGLSRTFQSVELFDDLSVMDNLLVAAEPSRWWTLISDLVVPRRSTAAVRRAESALELLGLEHLADRTSTDLSEGQRKLVGVARALAGQPRLVLVDEPAAGLDAAESAGFGLRLRTVVESGITVLLVDHDMGLVLSACDRLCVLDFGRLIADGHPDQVRNDPAVVAAYLGRAAGQARARGGDAVGAARGHVIKVREHVAELEESLSIANAADGAAEDAVLAVRGLVAGYNGVAVVRGIDLHVGPREVVALLGPNGAGKTTTLLTVSGILASLGGEVSVLGKHLGKLPAHAVARLGMAHVSEDRSLFFGLTVDENLRLGVRLGGPREAQEGIDYALGLFPALVPLRKRKAGVLSGGEQQMLAMARAMVSRPKILLVDELSLGLAPLIVERLLPLVRELAAATGCGVLLVEQHVDLALEVADRAYVMSNGRITVSGSATHLIDRHDLLESSYLGSARAAAAVNRPSSVRARS